MCGLSFKVKTGDVHGLLGPNGAGKTTAFKLIMGFAFPDSGKVEVLGTDPSNVEVRSKIGFLPEQPYFYRYMKGAELLNFYSKIFGLKKGRQKVLDLLDLAGLSNDLNVKISNYSRGMLQRLGIAQALLNDPDLLVLDEPSSGLDPLGQEDIKALMKDLKNEGKTVLLSSHQLSSVEDSCDTVTIIGGGRALEEGSVRSLLSHEDNVVMEVPGELQELPEELLELAQSTSSSNRTSLLTIPAKNKKRALALIAKSQTELISLNPREESLEEHFIELVRDSE